MLNLIEPVIEPADPSTKPMGQIHVTLTLTNRIDQALAARGDLDPAQVRQIVLDQVLVDTGATHLCLPKTLVDRLGLTVLRNVMAMTANGLRPVRIMDDARLEIMGRAGTFSCIELSDEAEPLLGVIPLEELGLELDLQRQVLRLLPEDAKSSYLRV